MQIFKPFEKQLCPVTNELAQLDPVLGLSLDAIASQVRRGELELDFPWALHPEIGFETRFHSRPVCNFKFQLVKHRGQMLVSFSEEFDWMRNLSQNGKGHTENYWKYFLRANIRNIFLSFDSEDRETQISAEVKINSHWFSFNHITAAGSVVFIPTTGVPHPVEIPVRFQDLDYLLSYDKGGLLTSKPFEKFVKDAGVENAFYDIIRSPGPDSLRGSGYGLLARLRQATNLSIPALVSAPR